MRQTRGHRITTGTALGVLPLFFAAGCSFSFGGSGAVDADQVAERSSAMLAEQVGQTPDDFTCADDLPAEVGAEIRCELASGGDTMGVTITVTEVAGQDVNWDIEVDDEPAGDSAAGGGAEEAGEPAPGGNTGTATEGVVAAEDVAEQSAAALEAEVGQTPEDFSCSQGLRAEVGTEIRCNFQGDGTLYGVTITVTEVNGDDVSWDIKVDDQPL
ncbi:DUF4333 domain-containing protein [Nocardiopsis coralliicola]